MVYFFKTPSPKAERSVRFASSPAKSGRQLLGPTNHKSSVGQYSRTDHTNTVTIAGSSSLLPVVLVEYGNLCERPAQCTGKICTLNTKYKCYSAVLSRVHETNTEVL
jgi:hypothetical protein